MPVGFPADFVSGEIDIRNDVWPKYKNQAVIKDGILSNRVVISSGWSSKDLLSEFINNNCKPIKDSKGQQTTFVISKTGAIEVIKDRLDKQSHVISVLTNFGGPQKAASEIDEIGVLFDDYPKPIILIKYLLRMIAENDFIVLDFFAGSSTTAHAVLDLNNEDGGKRKFINVQLAELCKENSKAFQEGYATIANIAKDRIVKVIKKIKEEEEGKLDFGEKKQDLGFKVFKLQESNFKIWRTKLENEEELLKQMKLHTDPVDEHAETVNILYELLLKSGVPLTAKIDEKKRYYLVNDGEIVLMLEKMDEEIMKAVIAKKPKKVLTLDRLFKNNDQLKTNTALQMKDAEIDFRVV